MSIQSCLCLMNHHKSIWSDERTIWELIRLTLEQIQYVQLFCPSVAKWQKNYERMSQKEKEKGKCTRTAKQEWKQEADWTSGRGDRRRRSDDGLSGQATMRKWRQGKHLTRVPSWPEVYLVRDPIKSRNKKKLNRAKFN